MTVLKSDYSDNSIMHCLTSFFFKLLNGAFYYQYFSKQNWNHMPIPSVQSEWITISEYNSFTISLEVNIEDIFGDNLAFKVIRKELVWTALFLHKITIGCISTENMWVDTIFNFIEIFTSIFAVFWSVPYTSCDQWSR